MLEMMPAEHWHLLMVVVGSIATTVPLCLAAYFCRDTRGFGIIIACMFATEALAAAISLDFAWMAYIGEWSSMTLAETVFRRGLIFIPPLISTAVFSWFYTRRVRCVTL